MNANESYNGWTNYETWNCNLWLSQDAAIYHMIQAFIENNRNDEDLADELADWLSDLVDTMKPELKTSMFSDLLTNALNQIDFYEIAENWLKD